MAPPANVKSGSLVPRSMVSRGFGAPIPHSGCEVSGRIGHPCLGFGRPALAWQFSTREVRAQDIRRARAIWTKVWSCDIFLAARSAWSCSSEPDTASGHCDSDSRLPARQCPQAVAVGCGHALKVWLSPCMVPLRTASRKMPSREDTI